MMTQSVKAMNFFGGSTAEKTSAVKTKNSGYDFNSIMDSNLKSKTTAKKENSTVKDADSGNETSTGRKTDQRVKDYTDTKDAGQKEGKDAKTGSADIRQAKDALKTDSRQDSGSESELHESLQSLLALLQNTIQSGLGITNEELENAMENLGFAAADLLNPDNLKQLILQVSKTDDITAVLTDENLANTMKQLIQAVEELKSGQNFPISREELTELISQFQKADLTKAQTASLEASPEIPYRDLTGEESISTDKQNAVTLEIHKFQDTEIKDSDSSAQDSGKQETDVKTPSPVEVFVQNLAVKGNESGLNFADQIANIRQMQDITNQIVEQIKITIKPEQTSMELTLNPESLGKINLSVVAKDGIMTAHFTAQNELAKEAIESQMQVLKENLNNQGLKVESIEVTVSNFSFDQSSQTSGGNEKEPQSRSRSRNLSEPEPDIYANQGVNEIQDAALAEQSGSSIDYTA